MNTISIICNGDDYKEEKIKEYCKRSDYIIAVDGGLYILDKLSIKPNIIIGDMDSVSDDMINKYSSVQKEVYSTDKDLTDSEIAIKNAMKLQPKEICLFAVTGDYIDHSIANILNLLRNTDKNIELKLITKNSSILPIADQKKYLNNYKGRRFSLFPIGNIKDLRMAGCKYTFKNKKDLSPLDYSISNVITENQAIVEIKKGMAVIVIFDEKIK